MASTPKETTSKVEPWDGAQPYLKDVYKQFDQLLKDGAPKPYDGKTYSEQSDATKQSLNMAENLAKNGDTSALTNANKAVNAVMNQSGNTQANNTLSQLQNGVNLGTNPTTNFANNVMNGNTPSAPGNFNQNFSNPAMAQAAGTNGYTNAAMAGQQAQASQLANSNNPALAYLQGTASGANIGKNPYLDQMVGQQQDAIAKRLGDVTNPAIAGQAASLGRMGSNSFATQMNNAQSAAANEMSKVATDMYANQYNQDVTNQMNAAQQYGNLANQDVANRLNANQALSNTSNAQQQQRLAGMSLYGDLANNQEAMRQNAAQGANAQFNAGNQFQLAGAQMAGNNYQQNIANMLGIRDSQMNAANSSINAGNAANSQKLQAANMAGQTYQNQYLPADMLGKVGDQRDQFNDTKLQADISAWDRAAHGPLNSLGQFANLLNSGNFSNTTTPVHTNTGAQLLGGLSSLAGLFALCSAKVKTIHSFVGVMPLVNGGTINIYQFSYTDDETNTIYVGPIAEEVEEQIAGSVVEFGGKKHIDVAVFMKEAA